MKKRMILVEVDGVEREVPLASEALRIGRSSSCDVCLEDDEVSREHAVLVWKGTHWNLRDRGSTNGTMLDGERVLGERPIAAGQTIAIGCSRIRFVDLPAPAAGAITRRREGGARLELQVGEGWARVRLEAGGQSWDGPIPRQQARHLWLLLSAGRDERGQWKWVEMDEEYRVVSYGKDKDPSVPVHASRHRLRQWWAQVRQGFAAAATGATGKKEGRGAPPQGLPEELPEDLIETQRHAVRATIPVAEVRIPEKMP